MGKAGLTTCPSAPDTPPVAARLPQPERSSTTELCWPEPPPPAAQRAARHQEQEAAWARSPPAPPQSHPDPSQSSRPWSLDWRREHNTEKVKKREIFIYFKSLYFHFYESLNQWKRENGQITWHCPLRCAQHEAGPLWIQTSSHPLSPPPPPPPLHPPLLLLLLPISPPAPSQQSWGAGRAGSWNLCWRRTARAGDQEAEDTRRRCRANKRRPAVWRRKRSRRNWKRDGERPIFKNYA